jgi:ribosomal protein L20A (L18A)
MRKRDKREWREKVKRMKIEIEEVKKCTRKECEYRLR